jgi:hypothetical protein
MPCGVGVLLTFDYLDTVTGQVALGQAASARTGRVERE